MKTNIFYFFILIFISGGSLFCQSHVFFNSKTVDESQEQSIDWGLSLYTNFSHAIGQNVRNGNSFHSYGVSPFVTVDQWSFFGGFSMSHESNGWRITREESQSPYHRFDGVYLGSGYSLAPLRWIQNQNFKLSFYFPMDEISRYNQDHLLSSLSYDGLVSLYGNLFFFSFSTTMTHRWIHYSYSLAQGNTLQSNGDVNQSLGLIVSPYPFLKLYGHYKLKATHRIDESWDLMSGSVYGIKGTYKNFSFFVHYLHNSQGEESPFSKALYNPHSQSFVLGMNYDL